MSVEDVYKSFQRWVDEIPGIPDGRTDDTVRQELSETFKTVLNCPSAFNSIASYKLASSEMKIETGSARRDNETMSCTLRISTNFVSLSQQFKLSKKGIHVEGDNDLSQMAPARDGFWPVDAQDDFIERLGILFVKCLKPQEKTGFGQRP